MTVLYNEVKLDKVLRHVSSLGFEAVEIAAWRGSNHIEAQLILGPHDASTDPWFNGTTEEKIRYGTERIKKTAEAAAALDVPVVNGFIGCPNWGAWYNFPPAYQEIFEKGFELFAERWGPILDFFANQGLKFAHEVHPQEQVYNIETAEKALEVIGGRKEFGFNLDPSHFVWQGIDPVVFIKKFKDRIYHFHAKDGELVKENLSTAGNTSTGDWRRLGRGFRFRTVGWGDLNWKRIITALAEVGYDYVLSYEHEDPIMSREDGCEKCLQFLKPLIIKAQLEKVWW